MEDKIRVFNANKVSRSEWIQKQIDQKAKQLGLQPPPDS